MLPIKGVELVNGYLSAQPGKQADTDHFSRMLPEMEVIRQTNPLPSQVEIDKKRTVRRRGRRCAVR
jgi:hypothetical protein